MNYQIFKKKKLEKDELVGKKKTFEESIKATNTQITDIIDNVDYKSEEIKKFVEKLNTNNVLLMKSIENKEPIVLDLTDYLKNLSQINYQATIEFIIMSMTIDEAISLPDSVLIKFTEIFVTFPFDNIKGDFEEISRVHGNNNMLKYIIETDTLVKRGTCESTGNTGVCEAWVVDFNQNKDALIDKMINYAYDKNPPQMMTTSGGIQVGGGIPPEVLKHNLFTVTAEHVFQQMYISSVIYTLLKKCEDVNFPEIKVDKTTTFNQLLKDITGYKYYIEKSTKLISELNLIVDKQFAYTSSQNSGLSIPIDTAQLTELTEKYTSCIENVTKVCEILNYQTKLNEILKKFTEHKQETEEQRKKKIKRDKIVELFGNLYVGELAMSDEFSFVITRDETISVCAIKHVQVIWYGVKSNKVTYRSFNGTDISDNTIAKFNIDFDDDFNIISTHNNVMLIDGDTYKPVTLVSIELSTSEDHILFNVTDRNNLQIQVELKYIFFSNKQPLGGFSFVPQMDGNYYPMYYYDNYSKYKFFNQNDFIVENVLSKYSTITMVIGKELSYNVDSKGIVTDVVGNNIIEKINFDDVIIDIKEVYATPDQLAKLNNIDDNIVFGEYKYYDTIFDETFHLGENIFIPALLFKNETNNQRAIILSTGVEKENTWYKIPENIEYDITYVDGTDHKTTKITRKGNDFTFESNEATKENCYFTSMQWNLVNKKKHFNYGIVSLNINYPNYTNIRNKFMIDILFEKKNCIYLPCSFYFRNHKTYIKFFCDDQFIKYDNPTNSMNAKNKEISYIKNGNVIINNLKEITFDNEILFVFSNGDRMSTEFVFIQDYQMTFIDINPNAPYNLLNNMKLQKKEFGFNGRSINKYQLIGVTNGDANFVDFSNNDIITIDVKDIFSINIKKKQPGIFVGTSQDLEMIYREMCISVTDFYFSISDNVTKYFLLSATESNIPLDECYLSENLMKQANGINSPNENGLKNFYITKFNGNKSGLAVMDADPLFLPGYFNDENNMIKFFVNKEEENFVKTTSITTLIGVKCFYLDKEFEISNYLCDEFDTITNVSLKDGNTVNISKIYFKKDHFINEQEFLNNYTLQVCRFKLISNIFTFSGEYIKPEYLFVPVICKNGTIDMVPSSANCIIDELVEVIDFNNLKGIIFSGIMVFEILVWDVDHHMYVCKIKDTFEYIPLSKVYMTVNNISTFLRDGNKQWPLVENKLIESYYVDLYLYSKDLDYSTFGYKIYQNNDEKMLLLDQSNNIIDFDQDNSTLISKDDLGRLHYIDNADNIINYNSVKVHNKSYNNADIIDEIEFTILNNSTTINIKNIRARLTPHDPVPAPPPQPPAAPPAAPPVPLSQPTQEVPKTEINYSNFLTLNSHGAYSSNIITVPENIYVLVPNQNGFVSGYTLAAPDPNQSHEKTIYTNNKLPLFTLNGNNVGWKLYSPGMKINNIVFSPFNPGEGAGGHAQLCDTIKDFTNGNGTVMTECLNNGKAACIVHVDDENHSTNYKIIKIDDKNIFKIKICGQINIKEIFEIIQTAQSRDDKNESPQIATPSILIPMTCNDNGSSTSIACDYQLVNMNIIELFNSLKDAHQNPITAPIPDPTPPQSPINQPVVPSAEGPYKIDNLKPLTKPVLVQVQLPSANVSVNAGISSIPVVYKNPLVNGVLNMIAANSMAKKDEEFANSTVNLLFNYIIRLTVPQLINLYEKLGFDDYSKTLEYMDGVCYDELDKLSKSDPTKAIKIITEVDETPNFVDNLTQDQTDFLCNKLNLQDCIKNDYVNALNELEKSNKSKEELLKIILDVTNYVKPVDEIPEMINTTHADEVVDEVVDDAKISSIISLISNMTNKTEPNNYETIITLIRQMNDNTFNKFLDKFDGKYRDFDKNQIISLFNSDNRIDLKKYYDNNKVNYRIVVIEKSYMEKMFFYNYDNTKTNNGWFGGKTKKNKSAKISQTKRNKRTRHKRIKQNKTKKL